MIVLGLQAHRPLTRTGADGDGDGTSDFSDVGQSVIPTTKTSSPPVPTITTAWTTPDGEFIVQARRRLRSYLEREHLDECSLRQCRCGRTAWISPRRHVRCGPQRRYHQHLLQQQSSSVHGSISVDVGGGDQVNAVEFSPDSSAVAVAIGRSGNGGNGEVTSTCRPAASFTPSIPTARTGFTTSPILPTADIWPWQ